MAITTTNLNGTDSVAATRITLNDNFQTLASALNDVLSIIDIATGKINNYGYGSNPNMETQDLIVRGSTGGGINVISGGIAVGNGNIVIGGTSGTGFIQIGAGSNAIFFEKISRTLGAGNIPTVNMSGIGSTSGAGPVGYVTIPRLTTSDINAIINPLEGSLVYDVTLQVFKGCTGSSSIAGGSNWYII